MKPDKVEYCIIIKEKKTKVDCFKSKTTIDVVKMHENGFLDIDIKELIREAEEIEEYDDSVDNND